MGWYLRRKLEPISDGFTWKEWHHAYTGSLVMLIGFMSLFHYEYIDYLFYFIGGWWFIDDVYQHKLQKEELKRYGMYSVVTFWHWFPYTLIGKKFFEYSKTWEV